MNAHKQARGLDVKAFAQAGGEREQHDCLSDFVRLFEEAEGRGADRPVRWRVVGQMRGSAGSLQPWLQLTADVALPLTCQRCLEQVDEQLTVDRWFRFVADEEQAEREDEASEEDVLALDPAFDVAALVEDELLMEVPLVPRHTVCPHEVPMAAVDPDFERAEADKPHPFGALASLKHKPGQGGH